LLKPKKCGRCDFINPAEFRFCGKCGSPLDIKVVYEIKDAVDKVARLLENEDAKYIIGRLLKEKGAF
jgi:hypothetical protein